MHSRVREIAFGIGSFILGSIIGALIENQISSGISGATIAVTVLTVALFVVVITVFVSLKEADEKNDEVAVSLKDLEKRIGLRVLYQELKEIHRPESKQEDYLARLVSEAKFEILEVSRSEVHTPPVNPDLAPPEVRQEYYDSILSRVKTQTSKGIPFVYKRICQFPKIDDLFSKLGDKIYVEHCRQMIMLNSIGVRSYVKRTAITFPISFMLIDRQHVIISVNAIHQDESTNEEHFKGEIIITDPQQELVNVFLREWERIENLPYTQTLTVDDF